MEFNPAKNKVSFKKITYTYLQKPKTRANLGGSVLYWGGRFERVALSFTQIEQKSAKHDLTPERWQSTSHTMGLKSFRSCISFLIFPVGF